MSTINRQGAPIRKIAQDRGAIQKQSEVAKKAVAPQDATAKAPVADAPLGDAAKKTLDAEGSAFAQKQAQTPAAGGFGGGNLAALSMMLGGALTKIDGDKTAAPPDGKIAHRADITADKDGDGITDEALVGVPGRYSAEISVDNGEIKVGAAEVPRLPNLTKTERLVETRTADMVEQNLGALIGEYKERRDAGEIGDGPNIFGTDDVKLLFKDYNPPQDPGESEQAHQTRTIRSRGAFNTVVHQAANLLAKAAFEAHLAELPEGSTIMMTSGGTGAGKGFAIGNVDAVNKVAESVDAVWDSAGEQSATEAPWVLDLAKKFGHTVTFVHVENDPMFMWKNEAFGIIPRWEKKGRGPSIEVSLNSYADSAKNMLAMHKAHNGSDAAQFIFLSNGKPPGILDDAAATKMLGATASMNREQNYAELEAFVSSPKVKDWIQDAATMGQRIWAED